MYVSMGAAFLVVLLLAIMLYKIHTNRQKRALLQKSNEILEKSNEMLEKSNENLTRKHIEDLQDRDRVAAELWRVSADEVIFDPGPPLGEGAFATAHKAVWRNLPVAAKIDKKRGQEYSELAGEGPDNSFHSDLDALHRLRHPNIVLFLGVGQTRDGHPFILLELVSLGNLSKFLLGPVGQSLEWLERTNFCLDIARGMQYLHDFANLVHRDLKSLNVLVSANKSFNRNVGTMGRQFTLKITDFGLSKRLHCQSGTWATDSDTGSVSAETRLASAQASQPYSLYTKGVGSELWMAPEILRADKRYGREVDVFSYGVCTNTCTASTFIIRYYHNTVHQW